MPTSYGATLYCEFPTWNPLQCHPFTLSLITQINEEIVVINPPFVPYFDNITTTLSFYPPAGTIREFPKRLFDTFKVLKDVQIGFISASELGADSFYNCEKMVHVSIGNSRVLRIGPKIASSCNKITGFEIAATYIESIDENAFEGLTSLSKLTILACNLICVPARLFQPIKQITQIDFSSNQITALHSQLFSHLEKLYAADFRSNRIEYLPNLDIMNIGTLAPQKIFSLDLRVNTIKAIDPHLITSIYTSGRMDQGDFFINLAENSSPTCMQAAIPLFAQFLQEASVTIGALSNWQLQNALFQNSTTCYSDYTSEMASDSLVTCGSTFSSASTQTVSSTSTLSSSYANGGSNGNLPNTDTTSTSFNFPSTDTTNDPTGSQWTDPSNLPTWPSSPFPPTDYGYGSNSVTSPNVPGQCATDKICRYYLDWNDQYTCVIDGADGTVTSISGTHYLNYGDKDVTRVYFKNSFLTLIPKILFQKFPNLKFLHTVDCGLSIINEHTFAECGVLELWDASDNEVARFDETSLKN